MKESVFQFIEKRKIGNYKTGGGCDVYNRCEMIQHMHQIGEINLKINLIKYISWSSDAKLFAFASEFGYYDIIDVLKQKSIYKKRLYNNLLYVNDIQFPFGCGNSRVLMSDNESVRTFDLNAPTKQENVVSNLMNGYHRITLNPHDPNTFLFQFTDSSFGYFDLRTKHKMQNIYYSVLTEIALPIQHQAISPTRPFEFISCCMYNTVAFYDFRLVTTGKVNSVPSRGLLGVFEPFFSYRRPVITFVNYNSDGSEFIASEYNGATKVVSTDLQGQPKLSKNRWLDPHILSRTSYSGALEFNFRDENLLEKYQKCLKCLKKAMFSEKYSYKKNFKHNYTKMCLKHNTISLHKLIPEYEEDIPSQLTNICANNTIFWGKNTVVQSNKGSNSLYFWSREKKNLTRRLCIDEADSITYCSSMPNLPGNRKVSNYK